MWINLDDYQAAFLAELLIREIQDPAHTDEVGKAKAQRILDTLNEPEDDDDQKFRSMVATDDELEVEHNAVVSRGEDGAFVMSWSWISNEDAGITEGEDE